MGFYSLQLHIVICFQILKFLISTLYIEAVPYNINLHIPYKTKSHDNDPVKETGGQKEVHQKAPRG